MTNSHSTSFELVVTHTTAPAFRRMPCHGPKSFDGDATRGRQRFVIAGLSSRLFCTFLLSTVAPAAAQGQANERAGH